MKINYLCPYWGSEDKTTSEFFDRVLSEGYDGIEINLPEKPEFLLSLKLKLNEIKHDRPDFSFIAQCVPEELNDTPQEHLKRVLQRLKTLASWEPDAINIHTGKDYYSFEDNCRIIQAIEEFAIKNNMRIWHETHRGRFSFHLPSLQPYLKQFPQIKLTADYSHWCSVSESLLDGQDSLLAAVLPHVAHLHARVGHAQGAQVNEPFAPEWQLQLETFTGWWKEILHYRQGEGDALFTITPEFGPMPYMPALPYTGQPVASQWDINARMKDYLKLNL